jgi:hypothetical protein
MSDKTFKLAPDQIKPLIEDKSCGIASDHITVDGKKIGFMYREKPINEVDSGWRFLSGEEEDEYIEDPKNMELYYLNTIANYDPYIMAYLKHDIGAELERCENGKFALIDHSDEEE